MESKIYTLEWHHNKIVEGIQSEILEGYQNKIFRRKSKHLEGNQKSSQETKMKKLKSLEGSQKL